MNKEVHYEGWLIKSPPTKRIWRARWRRRWFTLKQGEIPEQFCLEYYTDRNCRKLKGVIDLDQCEQVDCGLRLENRKQKFQYMFDIKTPRRTYYLAADTEADMRDWVNCICQVCHLHDTKQSNELQDDNIHIAKSLKTEQFVPSNETISTTLNTSGSQNETSVNKKSSINSDCLRQSVISSTSQSGNDCSYVNTDYTKRETVVCENRPLYVRKSSQTEINFSKPTSTLKNADSSSRLAVNSQGVVRKIPENLILSATTLVDGSVEPSPALSTSSGPYIPISECFSGSPKFMTDGNPSTPLNNLDPKFYDTPRSHNNIGLNLTNDQSYSPKITNCGLQTASKARSGRSSPTDSESVFTDDDEWTHPLPLRENVDRNTRPSDSSVENESFVFTYSQRFSKFPGDNKDEEESLELAVENTSKVIKRKNNLVLDITNEHEKILRELPQFSDTENTSPAIGPRDASSCVEESYDIPRSHNLPYYNMSQLFDKVSSPENPVAASTPNLLLDGEPLTAANSNCTLPRPHCYTNAAPTKMDGNVFRYDFIDQSDLPPVNRKLKPKLSLEDRPPEELAAKPPFQNNEQGTVTKLTKKLMSTTMLNSGEHSPLRPPSVDRKSKPNVFKAHGFSPSGCINRRSGIPTSMVLQNERDNYVMETRTLPRQPRGHISSVYSNTVNRATSLSKSTQPPPQKNEHKLQYFDLDVSNPPPINRSSMSTSNLTATGSKHLLSSDPSARVPVKSSVVYNSVDFVKTDAFKKIREERKMGINK